VKRIYLDHAATTPIDKRIAKAMRGFESKFFGNPSSIHREGQEARAKIDFARAEVARFFNASPQEIIFTSGATESNNHAISGVVASCLKELSIKPHVITTGLEHQSVYNVAKELEKREIIEATFIKPDKNGVIKAEQVIKEIKDNTVLASMIFVSNEIGSVLPIREVGKYLAEYNKQSYKKIIFHTDAVQAVKFYNCNVEKLGTDLLTFSAHKINGPKGIGGLYIKTGTHLSNLMFGGSQEYDRRPGTQNSSGIVGMAYAYKLLGSLEDRLKLGEKIRKFTDKIKKELKSKHVDFNTPDNSALSAPDILNFSIKDCDQDTLIAKLDLAGIAASTGSACVSGSSEPSHVIKSLGKLTKGESATLRLSLGSKTSISEINFAIKTIKSILN
jgi:cysteine desulfurase